MMGKMFVWYGVFQRLVTALLILSFSACSQEHSATPAVSSEGNLEKVDGLVESSVLEDSSSRYAKEGYDSVVGTKLSSEFDVSDAPESVSYRAKISQILATPLPVLVLSNLAAPKAKAQKILLADARLKQYLFHPNTNEPLRNEVMSVKPTLPGDRVGDARHCQPDQCYRVDIYNFFHNATISAMVDIGQQKVLTIGALLETQPELSPRLEALAIAIAKNEADVRFEVNRYMKFLGKEQTTEQIVPLMAGVKSALKNSLCERSKHLCVAPTYVLGTQALWVIVDLTDMRVAGIRWTYLGKSGPPTLVTERTLENEYVFSNFCEQETLLERSGWSFKYHLTSSDGLRIANLQFNGKPVLKSAKVVDWHVSYSRWDGFGYSDATGCPVFSSAVVVAYNGPRIESILVDGQEVGFSIAQDFRQLPWPAPCNYRYQEKYEFYNDGRFRSALSNHGRGCGDSGTYRPVLRLDFGRPAPQQSFQVQAWVNQQWQPWQDEQWSLQPDNEKMQNGMFSHRLIAPDGSGYNLQPGAGQFGDGGRGDNAFVYAMASHPDRDEGESDLVTLGSCCNVDYKQGPDQFIQPAEPLKGAGVVLWYVPQIKNDGKQGHEYCWAEIKVEDGVQKIQTWPCTAGPMFVPIQ